MHADEPLHAEIRSSLTALVDAAPVPRRSVLEATLEPHRELITQAHAKGHNYRSITEALRDAGLKASPETIRRYVQRITKGADSNGTAKPNRSSRKVTARKTSAKS